MNANIALNWLLYMFKKAMLTNVIRFKMIMCQCGVYSLLHTQVGKKAINLNLNQFVFMFVPE